MIDFGPVETLDYDDDGNAEHVWVVTSGGLGSVAPSAADQVGDTITFTFSPPVCAGSSPGTGESSYFFGLASARPPRPVVAEVSDTLGGTTSLDARAPELTARFVYPPWWVIAIVLILLGGAVVWLALRKRKPAAG